MRGIMLSLLLLASFLLSCSLSAEETLRDKKTDAGITLSYVVWDAYMLGIDTPERIREIRAARKRIPVIGLVSFTGVRREIHQGLLDDGRDIEYVLGEPSSPNAMHDNYQISEVLQIARHIGLAVKIRVYHAVGLEEFAMALRRAGQEADIVITYHSVWQGVPALAEAIAANPKTLYIAPYAEIASRPPTGTSIQGRARHPDGTGLRNFITTIPLSRNAKGMLLMPSRRDGNDSETINVVAPSSYAGSRGETCPSVGVTAVVAAYIVSALPSPKTAAEEIIRLMLKNASVPEQRMLSLVNYDVASVKTLREHLRNLHDIDSTGLRRLEAEGVLDLWRIHLAIKEEAEKQAATERK